MSRREERHQQNKAFIIETAIKLIREKGLEKVSLRETAREAGYSPSSLYEYFENKEALLAAVYDFGFERVNDFLRDVPTELAGLDKLMAMGLQFYEFSQAEPYLFQLLYSELGSRNSDIYETVNDNSPMMLVRESFLACVHAGDLSLSNLTPEEAMFGLWAIVHGFAELRRTHLKDFNNNFKEILRKNLQVFLRGLD